MKTIWKNRGSRIWLIVTSIILVIMVALNVVMTRILLVSKTLDQVFGGPIPRATENGQLFIPLPPLKITCNTTRRAPASSKSRTP